MPALVMGQYREVTKPDIFNDRVMHRVNADGMPHCGAKANKVKGIKTKFIIVRFREKIPWVRLCTRSGCFG